MKKKKKKEISVLHLHRLEMRPVGERRVGSSESIVPGIDVCRSFHRPPRAATSSWRTLPRENRGRRGECDLIPLESRRGTGRLAISFLETARMTFKGEFRMADSGNRRGGGDGGTLVAALQKPLSPIRTAICRFRVV